MIRPIPFRSTAVFAKVIPDSNICPVEEPLWTRMAQARSWPQRMCGCGGNRASRKDLRTGGTILLELVLLEIRAFLPVNGSRVAKQN